jgi:cytochrome c biogenesis protein CcmG/thiol:disulfide interchange protein DsbE
VSRLGFFVPLAGFAALSAVLFAGFHLQDAKVLPSQLVGRPLPEFELASVTEPGRTLRRQDLLGSPSLLNVWATWCPNCVLEHPVLVEIAGSGAVRLVGINYNDDGDKARAWLRQYGDPYALSLADTDGRLGIDLGVYGAPETFVMDAAGYIRYRHVGPVTPEVWRDTLLPMVRELGREPGG